MCRTIILLALLVWVFFLYHNTLATVAGLCHHARRSLWPLRRHRQLRAPWRVRPPSAMLPDAWQLTWWMRFRLIQLLASLVLVLFRNHFTLATVAGLCHRGRHSLWQLRRHRQLRAPWRGRLASAVNAA